MCPCATGAFRPMKVMADLIEVVVVDEIMVEVDKVMVEVDEVMVALVTPAITASASTVAKRATLGGIARRCRVVVGVEVLPDEIATAEVDMVVVVVVAMVWTVGVAMVVAVGVAVVVDGKSALTKGATIHPFIAVVQATTGATIDPLIAVKEPTTTKMRDMTWVVQWDRPLKDAIRNHHPKDKIIVTSSIEIGKYAIEEKASALPSEVADED